MVRIVTGYNVEGKAVFVADGDARPGWELNTMEFTHSTPSVPARGDSSLAVMRYRRKVGNTSFIVVTLPARAQQAAIDPIALRTAYNPFEYALCG